MKLTSYVLTAALGIFLAGCSTVSVTTDYDRTASFSGYKSYTLAPAKAGQTLSPSSEAALRDSLRVELARRGIGQAWGGDTDLAASRIGVRHDSRD